MLFCENKNFCEKELVYAGYIGTTTEKLGCMSLIVSVLQVFVKGGADLEIELYWIFLKINKVNSGGNSFSLAFS